MTGRLAINRSDDVMIHFNERFMGVPLREGGMITTQSGQIAWQLHDGKAACEKSAMNGRYLKSMSR